jgi:hypothetical protein
MKFEIRLEIECGETTCASRPGEFCEWFGTRKLGQIPICTLFPTPGSSKHPLTRDLEEKDGWTQRCPECLKAAKYHIVTDYDDD